METTKATTLERATWMPICEYEHMYAIDRKGEVKRNATLLVKSNGVLCLVREKEVKVRVGRGGYCTVSLTRNRKSRTHYVHRLVAKAFIDNPANKPYINHKNGVKTDNRVENLEWVTHSENVQHAFNTGLNRAVGKHHPNATKVINVCSGESWGTIQEAADAMGMKANVLRYKLSKGSLKYVKKVCIGRLKKDFPFLNN